MQSPSPAFEHRNPSATTVPHCKQCDSFRRSSDHAVQRLEQTSDKNRSPNCSDRSHIVGFRTAPYRSPSQLSQRATVIISTTTFDREASPRKSDCWLRRCVGPEQVSECRYLTSVVTTGACMKCCFGVDRHHRSRVKTKSHLTHDG